MKKLFSTIYLIWSALVFTVFMVLLFPFFILPFLLGERLGGIIAYAFIKVWAFVFSVLTQIRYRTVGRRKIDPRQTYIYVCNHNSYLDTPGMVLALPGQFRPLGKIEMKKAPIFGWFYPYLVVMVDRRSAESRRRSIVEMKHKLRRGISIFIFPEGKMNRTDQPLTEFYDGAFRIAIETQTPVLPMVMLNTRRLLPRGEWTMRPGTVTTFFLDPIPTTGLTLENLPALKRQVYDVMLEKIEESAPVAI